MYSLIVRIDDFLIDRIFQPLVDAIYWTFGIKLETQRLIVRLLLTASLLVAVALTDNMEVRAALVVVGMIQWNCNAASKFTPHYEKRAAHHA